MQHYIITGTSRGLGRAMAFSLFSKGHSVHCVSRTPEKTLMKQAITGRVFYHLFDLGNVEKLTELAETIFLNIDLKTATGVCLINNAGILEPIAPAHLSDSEEVVKHLQINLMAPVVLSIEFKKRTANSAIRKMIINISSGAASNPYFGWSSYCSGKAAIEMFTKCTGMEQEKLKHPTIVAAIAPGIIETDMQKKIRSADESNFLHKHKFIRYMEEGLLQSPEDAAEKLIALLDKDIIHTGDCIDLRNV